VFSLVFISQEKSYGSKKMFAEFPNKAWSLTSLKHLLRKIDTSGSTDRKRTLRTAENVGVVEELSMSQQTAPGSHCTVHQIASEVGISQTTVHNIVRQDLKLQCFRKRRVQELTEANKAKLNSPAI